MCRVILLASPTQEKRHWDPPRQEAPEKVDIEPSPQLFCTCPTPRGTTHRVYVSTRDTPAVSPHLGESSYHQGEDRLFQATVLESPAFLHSVTLSYTTWEYIRSVCFNSRHASNSSNLEVPINYLGEDRLFQATVLKSPAFPQSATLSYTS